MNLRLLMSKECLLKLGVESLMHKRTLLRLEVVKELRTNNKQII